MADQGILSQEQIDALVSALSAGAAQPAPAIVSPTGERKAAKAYDFRSPDKLTKENLRDLNLIYDSFSRVTGNALSGSVRTNVDISVAKTDQIPFGEIMFGEKDKTSAKSKAELFVLFNLPPLPGSAMLQMDVPLVFTIIDRMLGGPGWGANKIRPLTALEKEMTQEILKKILSKFKEAWSKYRELNPHILVVESDPRLVPRVIPFHDTMVRTIFVIKLEETFGLMKLSLPYLMLNPLLSIVEKEEGGSHPKYRQSRTREEVLGWLGKIRLPMTIELGTTSVNAQDVLELQPGHVIPFEKKVTDPIDVKVGDKIKFAGQLGLVGERKAVQITKMILEGEGNG